jgi:hypothetical protein
MIPQLLARLPQVKDSSREHTKDYLKAVQRVEEIARRREA